MAAKAPFKFFSFFSSTRGRVSRVPFAAFVLPVVLGVQAVVWVVVPAMRESDVAFGTLTTVVMINGAIRLLTLWPQTALYWKRLHDVSWSGWLALPVLAPILWAVIVVLILRSTMENREYGQEIAGYLRVLDWMTTAYCIGLALLLTFLPGKPGSNQYGSDPRRPETAADQF